MAERRARPAPPARDKLAFLLSFVPWLVDRDRATVGEAAAHFGMSPDEIREAVALIAVSGVPGDTASYQHDDLFDIAWDAFEENDEIVLTNLVAIDGAPRFSAREAAAVIAGLQYLSALPENADRSVLASLMGKLSRSASGTPSALAIGEAAGADATLALIRESVERGRQLEFTYLNARGDRERRRVDPLRVESVDADWYLRGWCHTRQALRTFRLDRMSEAVVTDAPIEHRAGEVRVPESLFEPSPDDLEVTVEVTASALPLIADYIPDRATTSADGDRVRTTVRVSHYHGLKRLVAGLPGVVTVLDPPEARAAVREWAAAGLERYS